MKKKKRLFLLSGIVFVFAFIFLVTTFVQTMITVEASSMMPGIETIIGENSKEHPLRILEITEDAKRSSGTKRFCKCSKAKVLRIEDLQGNILDLKSVFNKYEENFIYTVGEIIESNNFIDDRWADYPCNIRFYITKQEAIGY